MIDLVADFTPFKTVLFFSFGDAKKNEHGNTNVVDGFSLNTDTAGIRHPIETEMIIRNGMMGYFQYFQHLPTSWALKGGPM